MWLTEVKGIAQRAVKSPNQNSNPFCLVSKLYTTTSCFKDFRVSRLPGSMSFSLLIASLKGNQVQLFRVASMLILGQEKKRGGSQRGWEKGGSGTKRE